LSDAGYRLSEDGMQIISIIVQPPEVHL